MKHKAQLAVETLLIYGIAILIVMIAIGALIGFGVLDLGGLLPNQCSTGDALTCENYVVSPTQVQLELRNSLGKNIDGLNITIVGEGDNTGLWQCEETEYFSSLGVLVNGEMTTPPVTINCDVQIPSGKKIQGVVYVKYKPVGSSLWMPNTGKIRATVS